MVLAMNAYLAKVPDSVVMEPGVFTALMKQFKHHHNVKFTFSKKHTQDILAYRKKQKLKHGESHMPGNIYGVPVTYDCEETGVL